MTLAAGRMRERITIQSKSVTRDAYGAEVVTWATLATVWAAVEPLSGREYLASAAGVDQTIAARQTRLVIRFRDDVMPWMRALHQGRTFLIQSAIKRGLDELDLYCTDVNEATA